ncbi:MAG TPA: hypothetical protein VKZ98_05460, partial [Aquaticitalea sp.]|nr:hypothetical protein [Aquaticitalea sp.]
LLKKKSAKLMQQKVNEKSGYGLALHEANKLIPGVHLIGHTGSAYGLYSAMFFDPKKKFGFVLITNGFLPIEENDYMSVSYKAINYLYDVFIKK